MEPRKRIHKDISNEDYTNFHGWLRAKYGRAKKCENPLCEKRSIQFEWALRRGFKYEMKGINFIQLCRKCHCEYDKREWQTLLTQQYIDAVEKAIKGVSFADRVYARPLFDKV